MQFTIGRQQLVLDRAAEARGQERPLGFLDGFGHGPQRYIEHVARSILAETLQQGQHPFHQCPRRGVPAPHSLTHIRDRLPRPPYIVVDPQQPMLVVSCCLEGVLLSVQGRAREFQRHSIEWIDRQ
jgi:hypothetical protein